MASGDLRGRAMLEHASKTKSDRKDDARTLTSRLTSPPSVQRWRLTIYSSSLPSHEQADKAVQFMCRGFKTMVRSKTPGTSQFHGPFDRHAGDAMFLLVRQTLLQPSSRERTPPEILASTEKPSRNPTATAATLSSSWSLPLPPKRQSFFRNPFVAKF